jgi:preprotein translocase subunit SecA
MLTNLLTKVFGSKHDRDQKRLWPVVDEINRYCEEYHDLTNDELRAKTGEFKGRLAEGYTLDDLLPEAFAAVKEACRRLVGKSWTMVGIEISWDMIPYDVQLIGGIVLHQGRIAEMATGEGKTLAATMPLYLNALDGKGAHLVTVNDYLSRRDAEWMGEIYKTLGLTVGVIQHDMDYEQRRAAYNCDITYGTNNEFGFDYLRGNMAVRTEARVQRGFHYAIVDEVDSVLVDEARTPLIISGPVEHSRMEYGPLRTRVEQLVQRQSRLVNDLLQQAEQELQDPKKEWEAGVHLLQVKRAAPKNKRLQKLLSEEPGLSRLIQTTEMDVMRDKRMPEIDDALYFAIEEKHHSVDLLEKGRELLSPGDKSEMVLPDLAESLTDIDAREDLDGEARIKEREKVYADYAQKNERIHNINQLLKAYALFEKDVEYVVQDGKVLIVDEFTGRLMPGRRYSDGLHQAIEAKEGVKVEGETQTLATITLQNLFRLYHKLSGMTGTAETEASEFWEIYKLDVAVIPTHRPICRSDGEDVVFRTKREKYNAIIEEIVEANQKGQPSLVGTVSVEVSELLSRMLKRRGVNHQVLNAKYHQKEAEIVANAGRRGAVTIATNMAGRGTDIKLGDGVADLGGLHIIGTERHEARRIDRQLRGRSGRQGDPGSSRFFLSLEDDLMRLFGMEKISGLMSKLGVEEGEVIQHGMVTKSIERAQKRVEAYNFDIRKHLLKYDDVMNKQRHSIYDLRGKMLEDEDVRPEIEAWLSERIGIRVDEVVGDAPNHPAEWDLKRLADEMSYVLLSPIDPGSFESCGDREDLEDKTIDLAREVFNRKIEATGGQAYLNAVRQVILWTVDEKWKDHLYELDHLKGGIQLRAYGQKDPLLEYQKEAFGMFNTLLDEVHEESLKRIFRLQLSQEPPAGRRREPARMVEQHASVAAFKQGPATASEATAPPPQQSDNAAVRRARTAPRAGRNDPCPCGSGKKYKKCHLPIDNGVAV